MYTVNIFMKTAGQPPAQLYFRDHTAAMRAYEQVSEHCANGSVKIDVRDEFGQYLTLDPSNVSGVNFIDVESTLSAQIDMNLLQTKAQASAQLRANADPTRRILQS